MSIQAVAWVLDHSSAEWGARLALISIANHADASGQNAWPSYATIAKESRMSRRSAIDAVARLEQDGAILIDKQASPKGTNIYGIVGIPSGAVSALGGEAGGEVDDTSLVRLASPEPSLNHKPRKAAPKRTQAQIESDRRYGGEGARIPETTPDYIRAVEAIAEPPNPSVLPQKVSPEKAAEARKLIQQQLSRRAAKV